MPTRGRPPKAPEARRNLLLQARVTEEEMMSVEEEARRRHQSVSDFVRATTLGAVRKRPASPKGEEG